MIKIYELKNMTQEKYDFLTKRSLTDIESVKEKVKSILEDVSIEGDNAVRKYTEIFDGVKLDSFEVTREEIDNAWKKIDKKLVYQIKRQISYSKKFHKQQLF